MSHTGFRIGCVLLCSSVPLFQRAVQKAVRNGVLYPFFGILLSPVLAAAALSFSSASVVGNALRLRTLRLP